MSKKQDKNNLQEENNEQVENVADGNVDEEQTCVATEEESVEKKNQSDSEKLLEEHNKTVVALELAQKELEEQKDQYLRLRAEFENYRRRTLQENELQQIKGIRASILAFFPCMDALDRAISISTDDANLQGLNLIKKQLDMALSKLGVTEINPINEEFDPEYHDAVMQEVDSENAGKVIQVLQKGYKYKDTLLKPAMVKVAIEEE